MIPIKPALQHQLILTGRKEKGRLFEVFLLANVVTAFPVH